MASYVKFGEVSATLTALKKGLDAAVSQSIEEATAETVKAIKERAVGYAPIETGKLRASAKEGVEGKGMATKGFVTFDAEYAVYVHEDLQKKHAPGTGAKFLERAIKELMGELSERTGRKIAAR